MTAALIVMAKAPVPGEVKTRLCPPCTPAQAAELARAALLDTLAAAAASGASRRVLALDGRPDGWVPRGFEVIPQRGRGLAARLANAFADVGGPALVVGMDTPQATPELLDHGLAALADGADAAFGAALDGGYWALGLCEPDARVFAGVPMSERRTGLVQRTRLAELGLRTAILPPLRDVDTMEDAWEVAREAPGSRFAAALERQLGAPAELPRRAAR